MNYLDVLYRAFLDYREQTANDRECAAQRNTVAKADVENDNVTVTRVVCEIENDWIDTIESGLTHVENALAQERQFIRADGEIVPIEKVKRVSRDSVEHLSKHSNLITKEFDGDDLIPEQLYTVERLNDYAVYENRFLYMLLSYLRDFIGMRYTKILDLTNTYHGAATFKKTVKTRSKEITFDLVLDEKRRDDPIMREINPCKSAIERIGMLLKTVDHFLSTPLMEEVAKSARLKLPVTKTNVLKMDKDFKGAVALYEYIAAYDKDGYSVKMVNKRMAFTEYVADEFAEVYTLASFLTYEYGMGIKALLRSHYDEEEKRRKYVAEQQQLEMLKKLRRHIAESGESPEGYMLLLEQQLRAYEGIYSRLDEATGEIKRLTDRTVELNNTIAALNDTISAQAAEYARLEQKYADDVEAMRVAHETALDTLRAEHAAELSALNENWQAQLDVVTEQSKSELEALREHNERKIAALKEKHEAELEELADEYENTIDENAAEIAELRAENGAMAAKHRAETDALIAAHAREKSELAAEMDKKEKAVLDVKEENRLLQDLKRLSDGRLNALRHQYGLMTDADDFTDENAFDEIENQYNAFRRFFKGEWRKAKKRIRDELLRAHRATAVGDATEKATPREKDDVCAVRTDTGGFPAAECIGAQKAKDEAKSATERDGDDDKKPDNGREKKQAHKQRNDGTVSDGVIVTDVAQKKSTIDLLFSDDERK